jgi:protein-S-isoprenylcysteine O-methyltransferase Ste14
MSKRTVGLGSEHPYCDRIQNVMIILYLVVWGADSLILNYSTLLSGLIPISVRIILSIFSLAIGAYFLLRSHGLALHEAGSRPKLADSGVYSLVRHPMYLGTLVFFLGFFFAIPSLFSLIILIVFSVFYDKMATHEENDLIRILGADYAAYQCRVPKWFPRFRLRD